MKVALIQLASTDDKEYNLAHARDMIAEAVKGGTDIVCLPEMFCCEYRNKSFIANQEPYGGPACRMLSEAARDNGVWLIGGSIPESDGGKLYNTSFVFNRQGELAARCRKSHLFDIAVKGGQHFKESDTFTPGDEVVTFDTEFGKTVERCVTCASRAGAHYGAGRGLGGVLPGELQHDHGACALGDYVPLPRRGEPGLHPRLRPGQGRGRQLRQLLQLHHCPPPGATL